MNIIHILPTLWQTEEINELAIALIEFQNQFDSVGIKKDKKNNHLGNGYVTLDNLINTTRPLLTACNLVISQDMSGGYLTTTLMHKSGQFKGSAMEFNPMAGNKGTNILQEIGGGITYAKRYTWAAILGISVDTDDDGNGMKGKEVAPKKEEPQPKPKKVLEDANIQALIDHTIKNKGTIVDIERNFAITSVQKSTIVKALKDVK